MFLQEGIPDLFSDDITGLRDHLFYSIGNIETRKNQLNLIRALRGNRNSTGLGRPGEGTGLCGTMPRSRG